MATTNSTEYDKAVGNPPTYAGNQLLPNEHYGRKRTAFASRTLTAADVQNGVINLFKLPAGARILTGRFAFDDMGTGITVDIGPSDNPDGLLDGQDTATAAGVVEIGAISQALFGLVLSADTIFTLTILGGDPTVGAVVKVELEWVLD